MNNKCKFCGSYTKTTFCSRSCAMKFRWTNEEYRKKMIDMSKALWSDPEYVHNMQILRNSEEFKNNQSNRAKEFMSNKETKEKCLNALKRYFSNKENRIKHANTQRELWTNEKRIEHGSIMKKLWTDPNFAHKCLNSGKKYMIYEFNDSYKVKVQGYEACALDILRNSFSDDDIVTGIENISKLFPGGILP